MLKKSENLVFNKSQTVFEQSSPVPDLTCLNYNFTKFHEFRNSLGYTNPLSDSWLTWFIGFNEGDGSLIRHSDRIYFCLTQKEGAILNEIQANLGFGTVYEDIFNNCYRFKVQDSKHLLLLCLLFNGNLVLNHRKNQLEGWIERLNEQLSRPGSRIYGLVPLISLQNTLVKVSLKDAWLSGFTDAEGCFNITAINNREKATFSLRYILDQKDGQALFQFIKLLFLSGSIYSRSKTNNVWRFEVKSKSSLVLVRAYFQTFPLKTKKSLRYKYWCTALSLALSNNHLTDQGRQAMLDLKMKINNLE